MKSMFSAHGIPQVAYRGFTRNMWTHERNIVIDGINEQLKFPMFVKPANLGSSVGISKAQT